MNKARTGKEGRGTPIEDPQVMQDALRLLFESEREFSIRVEGTSTLPYAARVQSLAFPEGTFSLRLVRPLPHEMPVGAEFRMLFAVADQRFEGIIALRGRDGYLQYGFRLPSSLMEADRRLNRRFPFRPRESAYVIAQDAGLPGIGVAGPLVNISMGGLALRVDRALRLDDGVRIPVHAARFERGQGFTRFRAQDLPRLPLLEGRAVAAHISEHDTELILGLTFVGMGLDEETALFRSLEFREQMYRGGQRLEGAGSGGPAREAAPAAPEIAELPAPQADPVATVMLMLQRRATRVVLVMAETPLRAELAGRLRQQGYHRLEFVAGLEQLRAMDGADGPGRRPPPLVLADLALARSGDAEPLAAVRIIERQMAELACLGTVILCEEVDPTLLLGQETRTRFLAYPDAGETWPATLDALLA
jgi:hypothetical protein